MKYNDQNAFNIKAAEFSRRVESALSLSRGDPIIQREYVSPENRDRFSVIGKLENTVSMMQTATINIEKLKNWLQEMKVFLEKDRFRSNWAKVPSSIVNNYISEKLACVKVMTEKTSFQGKKLLNGDSGVKGQTTGDNLRFIRGSARVISSDSPGYPIAITQSPRPSVLLGSSRVDPDIIREESVIAISDGNQEVRYKVQPDETPELLVKNIQKCLFENGLDINVYRTKDNYLFFKNNQLGSRASFQGMSFHTPLISSVPGQYKPAEPGLDVAGTIGSEAAHGDGGFLIGNRGNKKTDGLVIYYDGTIKYSGQVVGYVAVKQNGVLVPLDSTSSQLEILSIPSITPDILAAGVGNSCGFNDLSEIRGNNEAECRDSLRLIIWSITYLDFLLDELKWKEKSYVDHAVEMLRSTISPQDAGDEMMYLSKDKAKDMVTQLKKMLTPVSVMKVTSWN